MRSLLVCAALLFSLAAVSGQESVTPPSQVERKNKAPVSGDILRVKLPKPIEAKLKNGLTVLILEDRRAPYVNLQLYIGGAGALFEPGGIPGLANATATMLTEGTTSRTSVQIAEDVDRLGAGISAGSSFGSPDTVLSASGLSDNFDEWFTVFVDVLLNPSFPADELSKLKQRQRVHLREQRSSSGFLTSERFNRAVYGAHPAGQISATLESLEKLTREGLRQWHRDRYAPDNAILAIAGDVRAKELIVKLEKRLAGWKRRGIKQTWPRNPTPQTARQVFLVDRPNSVQTTVALGNIAIDRRSDDYMAMAVMNYVIGGGASSRLFLNLREEKGYTYGVYSDFTAVRYPGPWRAGGSMRTEVTEAALVEFFHEFRRIRDDKVTSEELEASKRAIVASFALSLEQPTRILGFAVTAKQYGFPSDYWDTYPAKIMAVTADDVQRVARKYLNPDALQIVAVGDASKIKPALEKYGTVAIFDANGAPLAGSQ
ncbi:MAG TPA: pitrilysin family protein [Candidatus Binatia bacterium]|nr:pitrilysin family protein [Candidatus Binatia bacterium]